MSYEIVYTSSRRGLRGSSGYTTVAASDGIPDNIWKHLEKLTGYEYVFDAKSRQASLNPIAYVHYTSSVGGQRLHIFGRVSNTELDYTGRSNLIAHLVAAGERELTGIDNPADVLKRIKWIESWSVDRNATTISEKHQTRIIQKSKSVPARCETWEQFTNFAGWGGALAESLLDSKVRQSAIIIPQSFLLEKTDPKSYLSLISETLNLLPPRKRREINFSTYFTNNLPQSIRCQLQIVVDKTSLATQVRRDPRTFTIDLGSDLGEPSGGEYVDVAQSGGKLSWESSGKSRATVLEDVDEETMLDESDLYPPDEGASYGIKMRPSEQLKRRGKQQRKKKLNQLLAAIPPELRKPVGFIAAVVLLLFVAILVVFNKPEPYTTEQRAVAGNQSDSIYESAVQPGITPASSSTFRQPHQLPTSQTEEQTRRIQGSSLPPEGVKEYADPNPSAADAVAANSNVPKRDSGNNQPVIQNINSQPPKGNSAAKMPPKEEPSAGPKPFDTIRRIRRRLPLTKPNRGIGSSSQLEIDLVTIDVPIEGDFHMEVLGADEIVGAGFEFPITCSNDGLNWVVKRKGKTSFGAGDDVGKFILSGNQLKFEWVSNPKDSGYELMNCLLKITTSLGGGDEVICALQKPKSIPPIQLASFSEAKKIQDLPDTNVILSNEVDLFMDVLWRTSELAESVSATQEGPQTVAANEASDERKSQLIIEDSRIEFWEGEKAAISAITVELEQSGGKIKTRFSKYAKDQKIDTSDAPKFTYPLSNIELSNSSISKNLSENVSVINETLKSNLSYVDEQIKTRQKKLEDKKIKQDDKENIQNEINNFKDVIPRIEEAQERNNERMARMEKIHQTVQEVTNKTQVHIRVYRKLKSLPDEKALVLVETEGFPD